MGAGAELFGAHGFEGVRVERIAAQAGVNKAMISYHFGGKQGLYVEIIEELFSGIGADLEALARSPAPAPERLRALVGAIASHSRRHPGFPAMLIREVISGGRLIGDSLLPRLLAVFEGVRGILEAGVAEGSLRPVDPILTHLMVVGSLVFFLASAPMRARMVRAGMLPSGVEPPTPEAFVVHVQELLARGLAARPATSPSRR